MNVDTIRVEETSATISAVAAGVLTPIEVDGCRLVALGSKQCRDRRHVAALLWMQARSHLSWFVTVHGHLIGRSHQTSRKQIPRRKFRDVTVAFIPLNREVVANQVL